MADHVTWGRTGSMGPAHAQWPDTYPLEEPEAAHAASEIGHDDREPPGQLFVGVFWGAVFTAICAAAAVVLWPAT